MQRRTWSVNVSIATSFLIRWSLGLSSYLRIFGTARWSRRALPWTWWRADRGKPGRTPRRRLLRGPWGPAQPEATLRPAQDYRWETIVVSEIISVLIMKCLLPVSLAEAQSQAPVKLSNLQLNQRSAFSSPSHTHQDWNKQTLYSFDTLHTDLH